MELRRLSIFAREKGRCWGKEVGVSDSSYGWMDGNVVFGEMLGFDAWAGVGSFGMQ